jgi:hypothetical protein
MVFIGNQPTAVPLTSDQLTDGLITTAKIATGAVENVDIASNTINLTQKVTGTLPVANGGTGLTALGTSLQVLRTNSGATALEFATASSDFVLLDTQTITTASVVSSVSVNSVFTTTYKCYLITFSNIATDGAGTANNNIVFQVKDTSNNTLNGTDYNFTGMDQVQGGGYLPIGANAQTGITIVENAYGAADTPITGYIYIFNPRSGARTNFMAMFLSHSQTGFSRVHQTFSLYQANTQIGGFIITATGNATQIKGATGSGFIKTYGLL